MACDAVDMDNIDGTFGYWSRLFSRSRQNLVDSFDYWFYLLRLHDIQKYKAFQQEDALCHGSYAQQRFLI